MSRSRSGLPNRGKCRRAAPHNACGMCAQGRVILATGCLERPIAFAHNDRPGVMLSGAVRTYVRRFGVVPGKRVVIATNNDDAYQTAVAVKAAGGKVVAILDSRAEFSEVALAAKSDFRNSHELISGCCEG